MKMMFSVKTQPQSPPVLTFAGECFYFVYKFSISCFVAVLHSCVLQIVYAFKKKKRCLS